MNIKFENHWKTASIISALAVILSIGLYLSKGLNYGVDFTGGTVIHYKFENPISVTETRKAVATIGLSSATIQAVSDRPNELIITTEYLPDEKIGEGISKIDLAQVLKESTNSTADPVVLQSSDVGPSVSAELKSQALQAIAISLFGILLYIWYRFDIKFGFAAVVALVHDVIITIGIFALLQRESDLTMVAALLTIIGYSLNDTIVICDRIRENVRRMRKANISELVSTSVNQSLSRTINTSVTTLIPVVILFFFGGETLQSFALAMMIGVIVGTYSSIYIASAIIVGLTKWYDSREKAMAKKVA